MIGLRFSILKNNNCENSCFDVYKTKLSLMIKKINELHDINYIYMVWLLSVTARLRHGPCFTANLTRARPCKFNYIM